MSSESYEDLLYEASNHVATITMNRPKVYNAFRARTCEELVRAFQRAGYDRDIGAIVLTGAGEKAYDVYVNPFLGDAQALAGMLGFKVGFQCAKCDGQLSLRLVPNPLGNANDLTGYFSCRDCGD